MKLLGRLHFLEAWQQFILKEDLTLWWNILLRQSGTSHWKVKYFFYRVESKIRGSCHYLVTKYFFWIENIPQDISWVSFCFTNHLIHNQVDYASSELHDSTQRKEIFPPTKTYCSFNKDLAGLLILMQCINKLYLWMSVWDPIRSSDNDSTGLWPPGLLHTLGADGHI